jgi:hypothetical protein
MLLPLLPFPVRFSIFSGTTQVTLMTVKHIPLLLHARVVVSFALGDRPAASHVCTYMIRRYPRSSVTLFVCEHARHAKKQREDVIGMFERRAETTVYHEVCAARHSARTMLFSMR